MPDSPSAGDVVAFKDYALTFDTNRLTIKNGGDKIQGSDSDFENTTEGAALEFIYVNATKGWLLIDFAKASDIAGKIEEFIVASGGSYHKWRLQNTHIHKPWDFLCFMCWNLFRFK